jgi:hypothetical protein
VSQVWQTLAADELEQAPDGTGRADDREHAVLASQPRARIKQGSSFL